MQEKPSAYKVRNLYSHSQRNHGEVESIPTFFFFFFLLIEIIVNFFPPPYSFLLPLDFDVKEAEAEGGKEMDRRQEGGDIQTE